MIVAPEMMSRCPSARQRSACKRAVRDKRWLQASAGHLKVGIIVAVAVVVVLLVYTILLLAV